MIAQREINDWAVRFGGAPEAIRRDHFISHVLAALSEAHPGLRFYGGTALCRTYLDGARLSEDIDLLHPEPRALLDAIEAELPRALRREYPDAGWRDEGPEGDGVAAHLSAPGVRAIRIYVGRDGPNTTAWEFGSAEVELRYSDLRATAPFACPTLATFGAMKLSAWYDRHVPRDLFDLAGLAEHADMEPDEVETILERKMGHGFVAAELARVPRSVAESWETELAAQVGTLPTVDECLARAARAFNHTSASRDSDTSRS